MEKTPNVTGRQTDRITLAITAISIESNADEQHRRSVNTVM